MVKWVIRKCRCKLMQQHLIPVLTRRMPTPCVADLIIQQFKHRRVRGAPFFGELMPGWRVRARNILPLRFSPRDHADDSVLNPSISSVPDAHEDISSMVAVRGSRQGRNGNGRNSQPKRKVRKTEVGVHMEYEQGGAHGVRQTRTGRGVGKSRVYDSDIPSGTDHISKGNDEDIGGSVVASTEGTRFHAERTPSAGVPETWNSSSRTDSATDDRTDTGRCGHEAFAINESGSDYSSDVEPGWYRRDGLDGVGPHRLGTQKPSALKGLFCWTVDTVSSTCDRRSKTIVSRVMDVETQAVAAAFSSVFNNSIKGYETWKEISQSASHFDSAIFAGLDDPHWRRTIDLATGKVVESRPFTTKMFSTNLPLRTGVTDIQTDVWYGTRAKPTSSKSRSRRCLMNGIRTSTVVFLLVAMVLLAAGTMDSKALRYGLSRYLGNLRYSHIRYDGGISTRMAYAGASGSL